VRTDVVTPPSDPAEPDEATPQRNRRTTVLVLAGIIVMGSLWVIGPFVFAGHDDPTAIDNKVVRKAVLAGCTQLRSNLDAIPKDRPPAERAEAENRAVDGFLAGVRALGPDQLAKDEPVERWLADWEQIVATRRQAVRDGKHFATPIADGAPINVRMFALIRSGLGKCDVPAQLLTPEPGRL